MVRAIETRSEQDGREEKQSGGEEQWEKQNTKPVKKVAVIYIISLITGEYHWLRPHLKLFSDQFVIQIFNARYSLLVPHIFPVKSAFYSDICEEISVQLIFVRFLISISDCFFFYWSDNKSLDFFNKCALSNAHTTYRTYTHAPYMCDVFSDWNSLRVRKNKRPDPHYSVFSTLWKHHLQQLISLICLHHPVFCVESCLFLEHLPCANGLQDWHHYSWFEKH